jgi:hypothetical protein
MFSSKVAIPERYFSDGREPAAWLRSDEEVAVRIPAVFLRVAWLAIGALAGAQRDYYSGSLANCVKSQTIAVAILAGPLNYVGVNPMITACPLPPPSP